MPIIEKGLRLDWSPENISCRMKVEVAEIALSHTSIYRRITDNKAQRGSLYKKLPRFGKRRCKGGKRKAGRSLIPNRVDITERPEVVELRTRLGDWEGDTVYGQDSHLVTLVDRKSRYTLIGKVDTNGIIRRTCQRKLLLGGCQKKVFEKTKLLINTMPRNVLGGLTPLEVYTRESIARLLLESLWVIFPAACGELLTELALYPAPWGGFVDSSSLVSIQPVLETHWFRVLHPNHLPLNFMSSHCSRSAFR